MAIFKNYDPDQIKITFAGIEIKGYADGTFVTTERAVDAFSMAVGGTGDVTRVRSRNRTGSVTLTLMAAAPTNESLSAKAIADENDGSGSGDFQIKDLNGTLLASAADAWIRKLPNIEQGTEASNREWVIDCAELIIENVGSAVV